MDLMDLFWGEDPNNAGAGAQGDWEDSPERLAQLQAEAQAQTQGTLAPGWERNRSIGDTGRFVDDLVQSVTGHGYSKTPEEMAWSRQKLAPIMEGLDNLTLGQGSKIPAGLAALFQSAGDGFSVENLKGHYNQNRGMQQQALQEWEDSIPNLTGGSIIPALRGVETVAGAIGSPLLGAVLNKVPGYAGLAGRGLTGKVAQGTIPIAITAALDKYAPGLSSRLGISSSESEPVASQEPYGPSQDSPMKEKAMFRVGNGEWQNGLDSRIGKNFSKGAPGSASAASERYRSSLEPNREDQIRQLYASTYEKIVNGYSKSIASITDPKSREAAMKNIGALAHETAVRVLPPEYQADYNAGVTDPNKDKPKDEEVPSTDGEGIGTLGGLAILLGAGGAVALAKKLGVPIPTAKAILQRLTGKAGQWSPLEKAISGGKKLPWKQVLPTSNKGVNAKLIPKTTPNAISANLNKLSSPITKGPGAKVNVSDVFERLSDKGILP